MPYKDKEKQKENQRQYRLENKFRNKNKDTSKIWGYCPRCESIYPSIMFYRKNRAKDGLSDWCKDCEKELRKKYKTSKTYYHKNKEKEIKRTMKWKEETGYTKKYYKKNSEKIKERNRKFMKTKNGKLCNARRSNLHKDRGFILLFENVLPEEIEVQFHHVFRNKSIVVPLPKITHRYELGKNHFKYNLEMIKKVYGIDVEKLLNGEI